MHAVSKLAQVLLVSTILLQVSCLASLQANSPLAKVSTSLCFVVSSSARTLDTICRDECYHAKVLQATAGKSGCPLSLRMILH